MALPTANNVTNPPAWGYEAALDNGGGATTDILYLRLADFPPDRVSGISTAEPRELPRITENPEDIRAEVGNVFSRSRFSGGEGLDRAHRDQSVATEADPTRFWDSRNIKVVPAAPGQPEELTLLHATGSVSASANTNLHLARIGTTLFWGNDTNIGKTANPTAASPTVGSEDPEAGGTPTAVSGLTVLGDELYAAIGAEGIHKRSSGGSWAHWSDLNCAGAPIWAVKGRIIASTGASLYEAASGAGSTLLKTLPSGQTWVDVVDADTVILAAATDGNIYMWVDESGTLVLRGQTDFEGEIPTMLGVAQGLVFIGTGQTTTGGGKIGRLWVAEVVGQRLRNAQVLRTWGTGTETRNRSPLAFVATRDSAFVAVLEDGSEMHLWRFHLATGGLTRDLVFSASAVPQGLAVVDDRLFVTISGNGLYRELTTFATSGYLIAPLADFFTAQPKLWMGVRCDADIPATQETITVHRSIDPDAIENSAHATWTSAIAYTSATTQATIDAEQALTAVESRYLALKVTLTPNTAATTSPSVYSISARALPRPADTILDLYVNVSDVIHRPFRRPLLVPEQGKRIWSELKNNWEGRRVTATLFRPRITVQGQLESVAVPVLGRLRRGWPTAFARIRVRGIKASPGAYSDAFGSDFYV